MKKLRTALAVLTVILLAVGYGASQVAYFRGFQSAVDYAERIDSPAVTILALALLVAICLLAVIPDRTRDQSVSKDVP